jgi:hypothetical protein
MKRKMSHGIIFLDLMLSLRNFRVRFVIFLSFSDSFSDKLLEKSWKIHFAIIQSFFPSFYGRMVSTHFRLASFQLRPRVLHLYQHEFKVHAASPFNVLAI